MSRTTAILLLSALLFAAGCGSDSSVGGGIDIVFRPGDDVEQPTDTPVASDDVDSGAVTEADASTAYRYHVTPIVEDDPVIVVVGETELIKYSVLDFETQGPADHALVRYELETIEPEVGASGELDRQMAFTGASGTAEVLFRAGDVAKAKYLLKAHVEENGARASSVSEVEIWVVEAPTGNLRVQLTYQSQLALQDIQVYLSPAGHYSCSLFNPSSPWSTDYQMEAPTPTSGILFEDLPADTRYVVFVTALGPTGSLAAYGCTDAAYVEADMTQPVTVELYTLVLNAAGLYDMEAVFDFTGAIPGEVGDIIELVTELFYEPADFMVDLAELIINYYFGQAVGSIVEWVVDQFRDYLTEPLNDWFLNESPDWLQGFLTVGQDLTQIVRNLTLLANLRIAKAGSDQSVEGHEYWTGLVLYWRQGCPSEGEPGYDPECGRQPDLSLEDIQNTEFPLDLVAGYWLGTITNFDHLSIDRHSIQLNYGRLILFVINEMLLPSINDDYHSLTDLVLGVVDCEALADGTVGSLLENLGLDRDDVRDFCVDSITTIVDPLILIVYGLGADSHLRLYGDATLIDDDDNLTVDEIVDGTFEGFIEMGTGASGDPFNATWDAVRQ